MQKKAIVFIGHFSVGPEFEIMGSDYPTIMPTMSKHSQGVIIGIAKFKAMASDADSRRLRLQNANSLFPLGTYFYSVPMGFNL